jgi:Zn-finger nucleic acid-binding protein
VPHRDRFDSCPDCRCALNSYGRRLVCPSCNGCLIEAAEFEELLNETSPDDVRPLSRRLFPATATTRGCPRCATAMTSHALYGVTLDRCATHGIWCDAEELAAVLLANGEAYAARQPGENGGGTVPFGDRRHRRELAAHIKRTTPPE